MNDPHRLRPPEDVVDSAVLWGFRKPEAHRWAYCWGFWEPDVTVFRCGCRTDRRSETPWPVSELDGIDGKVYRVGQCRLCWCMDGKVYRVGQCRLCWCMFWGVKGEKPDTGGPSPR